MGNGKTIIMSVKILLMSTGLLFTTILLLPPLVTTATSEIPSIFAAVKSYLRPPYLYFIINGIIVTIVASSRLNRSHHHAPPPEGDVHAPLPHMASRIQHDVVSVLMKDVGGAEVEEQVKEIMMDSSVFMAAEEAAMGEREVGAMDETDKLRREPPPRVPPPASPLARQEAVASFFSERPPLVSRFGHHRRPLKINFIQGGKALRRVAKPKKHDTLESTWKAITEGRHIPLTRHLKKSDPWENNHHHQIDVLDSTQTLTDRTGHTSRPLPSTTKLKKEPSLGQDELNRRVEAFINKFNEDMRLQRQQSMQQFMEMINRAA